VPPCTAASYAPDESPESRVALAGMFALDDDLGLAMNEMGHTDPARRMRLPPGDASGGGREAGGSAPIDAGNRQKLADDRSGERPAASDDNSSNPESRSTKRIPSSAPGKIRTCDLSLRRRRGAKGDIGRFPA